MILLIHPPVVKPCEPPPGISRLQGALNAYGIKCAMWDANVECLLRFMENPRESMDRWTLRAVRHHRRNLDSLRGWGGYRSIDRYARAVADVNRLLESSDINGSVRLSLVNYQDDHLSPVRSRDLLAAAEEPEQNVFYPVFREYLLEILDRDSPSVIGFSLNFLSQALTTFAMMGFLRKVCPSVTLVLGGGLVTSWMRQPKWKDHFSGLVDHTVSGQGESPLLALTGIHDVSEKSFTYDYISLPMDSYLAPGPIVPYSASAGCYWNKCGFCPERAEGNPYLPLPLEKVTSDLPRLLVSNSPALIHLLDNAVSPIVMEEFLKHPPGAPWYGFVRFTQHLADEDFCRGLKRSGCTMLQLGLESGAQTVLDAEQKGIGLDLVSKALKALSKAGIGTYVYLLFGTPSETLDAARRTLDFTVAHSLCIDFLNLAIFNLPVHSPEAEQLRTEAFSEGDLSLYTGFIHPRGWNRGRVRQFLDKEFKRHPAVAAILRRDPPLFTSNHAPFFCGGLDGGHG